MNRLIRFCLENRLIVFLAVVMVSVWGMMVAPFDWHLGGLPRDPVPVDAIPDIGENQQIVFTEWMGRSPQDVEDQVGYPLTVSLLGIPGVRSVRSYSMFGFSTIYVIFEDHVEFYWSRSRVLEKLSSLPAGTLPEGVRPSLGPDATALGQVFWYTLEGRDEAGRPTGGWDLDELRAIQDWYVRYALQSAEGIAEVASVGGFVREYQVDVDPDAMRAYGVPLEAVAAAVRMSNVDVGARSIEVNQVEYFVRGLGFVRGVEDLEQTVVATRDNVPVYVKDVAQVTLGPALRRGALDKEGAEAVGGVAVVRYGENPLAAIRSVKAKIGEIRGGLPERAVIDFAKVNRAGLEAFAEAGGFAAYRNGSLDQEAWLDFLKKTPPEQRPEWVALSKIEIVPFYDRSELIQETLGTLNTALYQEILITVLVVLVMVRHLSGSLLIAGLLPLAVLMTFIAMRLFGVDANIVALSGIAIAIGTMVDVGIVVCEAIVRRLEASGFRFQVSEEVAHASPKRRACTERQGNASPEHRTLNTDHSLTAVLQATSEVGGAVLTAVATTVVGFLPVFAMQAAEGKLFRPLAFTKTFALVASIIIALTVIPAFAHFLLGHRRRAWLGPVTGIARKVLLWLIVIVVTLLLAADWLPVGPEKGLGRNTTFLVLVVALILGGFHLFQRAYPVLLRRVLAHKAVFAALPLTLAVVGVTVWLGFDRLFGWLPQPVRVWRPVSAVAHAFPGLGKEFMPPLDEGSYLFMPTTMPHASIGEALDVLQKQDLAMQTVPEVDSVVGKLGRAESALDPAPISMFETVINYKPQFLTDAKGRRLRFKFDPGADDLFRDTAGMPLDAPDGEPYTVRGRFERDEAGRLVPDARGAPFRLWRPALDPSLNEGREVWAGIQRPDDIWDELVDVTAIPGTTSAPRLQPIAARIVMLQSGMRAPLGVKVKGPDLESIERAGLQIEELLKQVPSVRPEAVVADRIVGKPYLEIDIDRKAIARYGLHLAQVQQVLEVAVGGVTLTRTVEGRERYPVRVRYPRELRDSFEALDGILVPTPQGAQIPLTQLAEIRYLRGPQVIKSEDTFLVGYVIFDRLPGHAEVDVVEQCREFLEAKAAAGEFVVPEGVSYAFAGSYLNQVRATKRLAVVLPLSLFLIFIILYLQFRSTGTAMMVFSGIGVAWMGGFLLLWLYGRPGFLDVSVLGTNLRELFMVQPVNLSVAVWVGFLALFGIASDDGVLMATILDQRFAGKRPRSRRDIRDAVVEGARRRIRPALMTSATTLLALLPVLTSTGRGADIMIPMAIPVFGGMVVALITVFVVPVLYCWREEQRLRRLHPAGATT